MCVVVCPLEAIVPGRIASLLSAKVGTSRLKPSQGVKLPVCRGGDVCRGGYHTGNEWEQLIYSHIL